jgi:hypothetical protein
MKSLSVDERTALSPSLTHGHAYILNGADLKKVFHAGKSRIRHVDKERLGERDPGWYGAGFYVSLDPKYVKKWYGPVVSEFDVADRAKVLVASISADKAPPGLFDAVVNHDLSMPSINKADTDFISQLLKTNQLEWVHAVDRLAEAQDFDVVAYNDYEIVVKNPSVLSPAGKKKKRAEFVPLSKKG